MLGNERLLSTGHLYEAPRRLQIFYNSRKRSAPPLTPYSDLGKIKHAFLGSDVYQPNMIFCVLLWYTITRYRIVADIWFITV